MTDPRNAYRQSAARGASPVRLVVLLYEQMIEDLRHAVKAIEQKNVELRTSKINHAVTVLGHLQGKLDLEQGGSIARQIERFYNYLRFQMVRAQMMASADSLRQQITDLLTLRDSWIEVERKQQAGASPAVSPDVSNSHILQQEPADWRG